MTLFFENYQLLFLVSLGLIAFLYSTVGHGGASGYLALMAIFNFSVDSMRPTALLLNLFVAALAFYHFWKKGYFNRSLFIYFALASIPLSFIGGIIQVNPAVYQIILACFLLFSIAKLLTKLSSEKRKIKKVRLYQGLAIGGFVGFFSGLIGIGGGIILSPLIIFMRWGTIKEAAAVSALFIWVNSAAGLLGQLVNGATIEYDSLVYVCVVLVGGALGSFFGSAKFKPKFLKLLLVAVLLLAFIKLILI